MAVNYNPKIVTSGLALCLDAANTKSYPGSGTVWTDISGNNLNGTLQNGPVFASTASGRIVFDGTNDTVSIGQTSTSISNNFTIEFWCMPSVTHEIDGESTSGTVGTSGQRYIFGAVQMGVDGGAGISVGTNGVSVYEHGNSYMPALLVSSTTVSSTVMTHIAVVYISKQPRLYLNGVLTRVGLTSTKTNVYPTIANIGSGQYGVFGGAISVVRVYNRSLSAAEVEQNFNAMRGRFGV